MFLGNIALQLKTEPFLLEEVPETISPKPTSNGSRMKRPQDIDPFCHDDAQLRPVAPERRLLLAVFSAAFIDLISSSNSKRNDALRWFEGRLPDELVSYKFFCSHFNLKPSRLRVLEACMKDRNAIYEVRDWKKFRNVGNRRK